MEENKVATDSDLRAIADKYANYETCQEPCWCQYTQGGSSCTQNLADAIFRDLVAVRDQARRDGIADADRYPKEPK